MTRRIISKNAIRCVHCGEIIESRSVHDLRWCSCHTVAVDGGLEYMRRLFREKGDFEELSVYEDIEEPQK